MSRWRKQAAPIIRRVLEANAGASEPTIRRALRDAYPFGPRRYHPYKIWLDEIHRQRGSGKHAGKGPAKPSAAAAQAMRVRAIEIGLDNARAGAWSWGHLPDHEGPCNTCHDPSDVDDPDNCPTCGGDQTVRWGSWYDEDRGECEVCGAADVGISEGEVWLCLRCRVAHHAEACGCDRWRAAERDLGVRRDGLDAPALDALAQRWEFEREFAELERLDAEIVAGSAP
ncbi:MAG: hypothetical protein RID81_06820 [Sandaracinaceae bacterium]